MTKIFLDTNILLDLLVRPEFSIMARRVLNKGFEDEVEYCISFLSVANFAYILRKNDQDTLYNYLSFICHKFSILKNEKSSILNAIKLKAKDFEDALQYDTAVSGGCQCIITRNKKDFYFSDLSVYTPEEFLEINR